MWAIRGSEGSEFLKDSAILGLEGTESAEGLTIP